MGDTDELTMFVVTRYIVGYKKEESDYLLKFLYDHIALSQDLQARIRWKAGTVVVWDVSLLALSSGLKIEIADLSRTVWPATRPSSIGRMVRGVTSPVSHHKQSRPSRRRLKARLGILETSNVLNPYDYFDNHDISEPKYRVLIARLQETDSVMRRRHRETPCD